MRRSILLLLTTISFACSSPGKPPEAAPEPSAAATASSPPDQTAEPPPPASTAKPRDKRADVPDDHDLTNRDCADLGRQLGEVTKADLMAGLSPKLSAKQKSQAEANIDAAVAKSSSQWIEHCQSTLVGKTVERERIVCAMRAKSVKTFDNCLNPEPGAGAAPPPDGKKK